MRGRRLVLGAGALALLLGAAGVVLAWFATPTPGVTLENYQRLRHGMTEREVQDVLGGPGEPISFFKGVKGWEGQEVDVFVVFAGGAPSLEGQH
jgi:hypothetical protein